MMMVMVMLMMTMMMTLVSPPEQVLTKVLRHGWCFAGAKSGGDEDVQVARSDFYHDHDVREDNVVVEDDHGNDGDNEMSGPHVFVEILMVEREEGATQSHKNPVSASAMLNRKFLQIRKVFATSSLLAEEFPDTLQYKISI